MKHKNTKAHEIPEAVKEIVYERDNQCCIVCYGGHGYPGIPNAHYISRARGGLGIEENIVTLCPYCHNEYDRYDDDNGGVLKAIIAAYLELKYPGFPDSKRVYDKWGYMK